MIIYVDILIILNAIVNYFMLLGIGKITRTQIKRWRIFSGALIGGVSSLLIFLENLGIVMTLLKILSGVVMVAISYNVKPIKQFIKKTFLLFAISFIFGGLMFAIYIFLDKDILLYSNGIVYFDIDLTFLIVCTVLSYMVITLISKILDKKAPKSKEYYVTIENKGVTLSQKALMDTGNNLREPFSNEPVIIVNKSIFSKFFTEEKIRLIPVSTVNGEALMRAFKPHKITIGSYSTDRVYIGESQVPLDEYEIILNINLEGELHND